nr:MAG TPA: hypothetical protein [Caudoviricetes sp.]
MYPPTPRRNTPAQKTNSNTAPAKIVIPPPPRASRNRCVRSGSQGSRRTRPRVWRGL